MPEMLTISVMQPIGAVHVTDATPGQTGDCGPRPGSEAPNPPSAIRSPQSGDSNAGSQPEKGELTRLCQTISSIAANLDKLYQETLTHQRTEIARLALEIARKILSCKVAQGDYDILAIVEEALKRAPTHQDIVVRLNPEDLPRCQGLQREHPDSPFAELALSADWSIGRAECLVETPKGIINSRIEEHLERIGEALQKVQ